MSEVFQTVPKELSLRGRAAPGIERRRPLLLEGLRRIGSYRASSHVGNRRNRREANLARVRQYRPFPSIAARSPLEPQSSVRPGFFAKWRIVELGGESWVELAQVESR